MNPESHSQSRPGTGHAEDPIGQSSPIHGNTGGRRDDCSGRAAVVRATWSPLKASSSSSVLLIV
jgi:hypothetical protein